MAEKTAMEVQVDYIEREVKSITKKLDDFIVSQDAKFVALAVSSLSSTLINLIRKWMSATSY